MKDTFHPEDWLQQPASTNTTPQESASSGTLEDIEVVTSRIEQSGIDITSGYDNWRNLGFSLSEGLGESGRSYYHRISRLNSGYTPEECDRQYDKCLKSHGTGITVKTFFQKAKEAGISIITSGKSAVSAHSAKSASHHTAEIAETAESAEILTEPLPTFSDKVVCHLPDYLKQIATSGNSVQDADILLLGTLTVLSSCMPHIKGIYDRRTVFPNLFLFVTARASSGKGRLNLCRHLVEPIHEDLRNLNEAEMMEYKHRLSEYNAAGKKKVDMEKPEEPPMRMLFIPANSSATAVYQVLNDNDGQGLMFETEGDTLANTFGSDYGNYSDGFRKAFHHETISYIRRKDREYVNIKNPRLSTVLTGTPRQVLNLMTDAENGLFSRFLFYYLDTKLVWNNVFAESGKDTLEDHFAALGKDYHDFHRILSEHSSDIIFRLTSEQQEDFNALFDRWQSEYAASCGDEFIATVRRLGVITFRIAMILSTLRIMEDGCFSPELICSDTDYTTARAIAGVIIRHDERVFRTLASPAPPTAVPTATQRQSLQLKYLEALPDEFDRKTYCELATTMGLNPKSIERTIKKWCEEGRLENVAYGKYRKRKPQ